MMKKAVVLSLFILFFTIFTDKSGNANPDFVSTGVKFEFKDKKGDTYIISGKSNISFFRSNVLRVKTKSNWASLQKVLKKTPNGFKFSYFYKSLKQGRVVTKGKGKFIRNHLGAMKVSSDSFFPQSIGTPTFIDKKIPVKGFWEASGEEIIDFRKIGIPEPYRMKFTARYRNLGKVNVDGRMLYKIHVFYVVNRNEKRKIFVPRFQGRYRGFRRGQLLPARLIGYYERIFYWDLKAGYWRKMTAKINFFLTFTNAITVEWKSNTTATMTKKT